MTLSCPHSASPIFMMAGAGRIVTGSGLLPLGAGGASCFVDLGILQQIWAFNIFCGARLTVRSGERKPSIEAEIRFEGSETLERSGVPARGVGDPRAKRGWVCFWGAGRIVGSQQAVGLYMLFTFSPGLRMTGLSCVW